MVVGADDDSRTSVHDLVRTAYAARSAFAHGGEPKEVVAPALRSVVRGCLLARLFLGDLPATDG